MALRVVNGLGKTGVAVTGQQFAVTAPPPPPRWVCYMGDSDCNMDVGLLTWIPTTTSPKEIFVSMLYVYYILEMIRYYMV